MAKVQTKEKQTDSKKGRIILTILIIIILLLTIFVGCFAKKLMHETNLKEQAKASAQRYIKENQLQFDSDISIPMSLLREVNYLGYFDNKCLDASYVIVHKNAGKLEYEPIIVCDNSKAILKLNGDSVKQVEVGDDYIEEGATVEGDNTHDVIINHNVDTSKKGTYGVTYKIPETDIPPVLRVVEVVDTTKPIISLRNSDILYLVTGDTYVEPGYKAIDNYDGDITENVKITGTVNTTKAGTYTIIYKVIDSSNNITEVTRQVIVRENIPTINLKGYATVYVDIFGTYVEEGYTATDIKGNNLTKQVEVSGIVNTNVVGDYVITYKVASSNGASIIVRRTIKVVDNIKPEITLNGDKEVTLEWGKDTYVELGATATDNYDGNINDRISITGIFNPNKLGTYYLAYTVTDASGNKSTVQRIIKVVDTEAPTITLKGNDPLYIEAGETFVDPGVEASDNHDKTLDIKVEGTVNTNVLGTYTITYIVTDASGNKTVLTRNVTVQDTQAPVITLKGDTTTTVEFGTTYVEPGYTATDNYDHFVQNNVVVNGTVDTAVEGTYTITYNVTDSNGNAAKEVVRTVIVKDTKAPTVILTSDDIDTFVKNATVNMKAFDTNHGLQSIYYAWKETEPTDSDYIELTYTENENQVFTLNEEGTNYLWVKAIDLSGNVTVEKIGPFKVDTSAPTVIFTPNGAIAHNIAVTPSVTDSFSGVKEVFYTWTNDNTNTPIEFTEYKGGSLVQQEDGTYYLWIKAVDNAGNEVITVSEAFIVDNAYPSITFTYPTASNVVKTAIVDVTAMGNSGKTITKVEYQWTQTSVRPTDGYTEWADYDADHKTITMPANLDGNYFLWIKATDSYGLVSYNCSRIITIDNTFPTIEITPNATTQPVQGVDITVTVTEDNVDKILWAVSTEADIKNVTLTESLTELVSQISLKDYNGTYYLHIGVLDKAGNYTEYTSNAFEFDNQAPEAPTITFDEDWTKDPVDVTITGTDTIEYSFDGETWLPYTGTFQVNENKTIYARATDVATNVSEVTTKAIQNIDTLAPTLDLTYTTDLTNKLTVSYEASDLNSGIATIYYAWTTDLVEPTFTETLVDATGTLTKNDVNGTYALWIKVVDNAGNVTVKHTSLLTLDKEPPVIDITSGNGTTIPVTTQDTTVNITDDSKLTIEYIYSTSSEKLDETATWTSWYDYNKDSKNTLTIDKNLVDGTYYLHIKALDEAGNSTYVISNPFILVNEKPNVTYTPATDLDYKLQINTTVTATLNNATIKGLYYAWSIKETADNITAWTAFNSGDTISKDDVTGEYYLYIKVIDNVNGNRETIVKSTGTFNLDKTNVTVTFDPNGTGTPVKEVETEIKATDDHSGIKTLKYAWNNSHTVSPDISEFIDYELGTTLKKAPVNTYKVYYLWVYAEDAAGNGNYTVSEAFIIDTRYPNIDLDPNRSNPVNDLTVRVTIDVDANKTIKGIYYAWDKNSDVTKDTAWTKWTIADYQANPTLTQAGLNGIYYLHVKVVDNNNLEAVKSTYALEFDNIPADVTITPSTNTTPMQTVKPIITVEETNDFEIYYSFTTIQDPKSTEITYTEWADFMNQGADTLTLGDKNTNGTYYLHVKVVDEAQNVTYETATYEFDNEAPDAPTITYDTSWTNTFVEITVNGTDIKDTLEYSWDKETWFSYTEANKPQVTVKGTTIYARSKDAAGNISEITEAAVENIDKSAPVVTVTPNTTEWTNKNVTLTLTIEEDNLSPIKTIRWAPIALTAQDYQAGRGNVVSLDTKKFENGVNHSYVEIYVEDEAGNTTIISTSVTNIDKSAPVITVNPVDVTIDEGTKYDVLQGVGATDNIGFGENQITYETDFDAMTPGTYTVTYTITDIAGNTDTATRTITVLDITDPTLDLTYDEKPSKELSVDYKANDNVSIDKIYYAWTTDLVEPEFVEELTDAEGTITKNDVEGNYALWIKVVDKAGNVTVKHTSLLTLDKTAPIVTITPDSKEDPVQNVSPIITVGEDNAYDVYYSVTTEADPKTATYTKWENFQGDNTDTKKFGESLNETYYVHIKVEDAAGNITYATATYEFDNIAPAKPTITPSITEWTNQDVIITITGNEIIEYSFDGENWLVYDAADKPSVSDNNTMIYARSKDVAGNISEVESVTIDNIDKTLPVVTIKPNASTIPMQNVTPEIKVIEANKYTLSYSLTQEADAKTATYTKWGDFEGDATYSKKFGEATTGIYYVHIKVEDAAGNITYATATYEFDNTAPANPTITPSTTEWTNQDVIITITGDETIKYSFDGENWLTYDAANKPVVSTKGTTIYTKASDVAGNESEIVSATIDNIDKSAPVVTVTPNTTEWTNQDVTLTLTISEDNLSPIKSIRWAPIALTAEDYKNGRGFEVDVATRKFTQGISREYVEIYVEDEAGNTAIIHTSVTNIDKETPVITVNPAEVTINEGTAYDVLTGVETTDNIGFGENELTYSTDFDYMTPGTYTITYTITDIAGNTVTATRTVNVLDITKPNLQLIGNSEVTIEVGGTYTEQGATAIDNVDGDLSADIEIEGSVDTSVVGTYTITYTVEDAAGNSISKTRTVNVVDTTKPEITLNGNDTVTIEVGETYTELGATATDNYDGGITDKIIITGNVNTNVVGTYTVRYNVVDQNNNHAIEVTRTVNVVDTTKPVITLNGDAVINVEVYDTYTELGAAAMDNYDGDITNLIVTTITPSGKVDTTTLGTYVITYSVVDASGNAAIEVTRTVNVVDTTAPTLKLKGSEVVTIEVGGTYNELGATAVDNYDGNLTANIATSSTVDTTTVGTYYVRYTVTDAHNNTATILRTVEVVDTTKPVITLNGDAEITIEVGGTYTELGATATDNYDGNLNNLIEIDGEVDTTVVDTYEITYTVEDSNGNETTVTRTIHVVDTTKPVINLIGDEEITIEVGEDYEELGATATDNYDGDLTDFIDIEGSVDTETLGTYTITYNVTDSEGNVADTVTRVVTVTDTTKPVITLKGRPVITIQAGETYVDRGATAMDNLDGNITKNIITAITSTNGATVIDTTKLGTYTITYNVVDSKGNVADTVIRTVNVIDTTAPILELVGDREVTIQAGTTYTELGATANDNLDGDITGKVITTITSTNGLTVVDTTKLGTYTITYSVVDSEGNVAETVTRTVTVIDTEEPVITLKGDKDITIEVGGTYTEQGATVVDNHDTDLTDKIVITVTSDNGLTTIDTTKLGTYTIAYNVIDSEGNVALEVVRTVRVVDTTKPEITLEDEEVEINLSLGETYVEPGYTAIDNYDGDITEKVIVKNNVDNTKAGKYTITYTATDENGNTITATRTVYIIATDVEDVFRENNGCEVGTDCFSTSNSTNNYFWYSGYLFRAYKSNADGSIKLITEGSIASLSYDDDSSIFKESIVENWLNTTFYNSLHDADKFLVASKFCNLSTQQSTLTRTTCTSEATIETKVGLLTLFEYNLLGGKDGYLNNGNRFFTMTRYANRSIWAIAADGTPSQGEMAYTVDAIRPVITLAAGIEAVEGEGTKENPYRLAGDTQANSGTALNNRYTGEYIKFNDQVWRIVSTDNNGTKIILDSYLQDEEGNVLEVAFGDTVHYNASNVLKEMTNRYPNNNRLVNATWYRGTYAWGQNPLGTSLRTEGNYSNYQYGLIRVGELMSGKGATLEPNGMSYWTMTENTQDNTMWHITTYGGAAYADLSIKRAIRPVIKLNNDMIIASGNGTYSSPYVVE